MLTVKTPDEALEVIKGSFCCIAGEENVPLDQAAGRVLCKDIYASEYVPVSLIRCGRRAKTDGECKLILWKRKRPHSYRARLYLA